jgi:hypothetical protein
MSVVSLRSSINTFQMKFRSLCVVRKIISKNSQKQRDTPIRPTLEMPKSNKY